MPRVLAVDARAPDPAAIAEAARVLRAGGLVAMPTETVYGLAARALDEQAVARVYAAKGRPAHHPLIAHVEGEAQARALAASWPEQASLLARAFWPGPLTVVVDRAPGVPAAVAGGGPSIAIRAPDHPVALALLRALGEPVAAPSANRYQGLSPTTAEHVVKELGDAVDLVLDAGPCTAGIESTVVDLRGPHPRVLRPGALDMAALRRVMPDIEAPTASVRGDEARVSPGLEARHYAPRARLLLADTWEEARRIAYGLAGTGARVGLVTHEKRTTSVPEKLVLARSLPRDPAQYARLLYRTLHDLDDAGVDVIVVQGVPDDEAWWAVADRLRRGSTD
jgi:L-threonylcarbamoyladenylate synthase